MFGHGDLCSVEGHFLNKDYYYLLRVVENSTYFCMTSQWLSEMNLADKMHTYLGFYLLSLSS